MSGRNNGSLEIRIDVKTKIIVPMTT